MDEVHRARKDPTARLRPWRCPLLRVALACVLSALVAGAAARIEGTDAGETLAGTAGDDIIDAKGGNDTILAGDGDDILIGGPGSDRFDPGRGNDVILLGPGSGRDQLIAGDDGRDKHDVIRFTKEILPDRVVLRRRPPNALVVTYGRGDEFTSTRHFEMDGNGPYRLDAIEFESTGAVWDADEIRRRVQLPTTGPDHIVGYAASEQLTGWEGNDRIYGGTGNDTLYGGPGNDMLVGDDGDDVLVGGAGDDRLRGEMGSDTYLYRVGDGMDTIQNFSRPGDVDVIRFVGYQRGGVQVSAKGNDLLLIVGQDRGRPQGIRVMGFNATNSYPITRIEFEEGEPITAAELLALFPKNARQAAAVAAGHKPQESRLVRPPLRAAKSVASPIPVHTPRDRVTQGQ